MFYTFTLHTTNPFNSLTENGWLTAKTTLIKLEMQIVFLRIFFILALNLDHEQRQWMIKPNHPDKTKPSWFQTALDRDLSHLCLSIPQERPHKKVASHVKSETVFLSCLLVYLLRLSFRKTRVSTLSGSRQECFLFTMSPAEERICSADVAGVVRYFFARRDTWGN